MGPGLHARGQEGLVGPHMLRTLQQQRLWGYVHLQSSAVISCVLPGATMVGQCPTLSPQVPRPGGDIETRRELTTAAWAQPQPHEWTVRGPSVRTPKPSKSKVAGKSWARLLLFILGNK